MNYALKTKKKHIKNTLKISNYMKITQNVQK